MDKLEIGDVSVVEELAELEEAENSSPRWRMGWFRTFRRALIVGIIGTVLVGVAMWINIPRRAIAWRIEREVAKRGYNLALSEVSVLRPWGVARLDDIVWTLPSKDAKKQSDTVHIDSLDVSGSVWSYLMDEIVDVDVVANLPEGEIQAEVRESEGNVAIVGKATGVPLEWIPKLKSSLETSVEGKVDLVYDLRLPERKTNKMSGTLEVYCNDCAVGNGQSKIKFPGATGMAKNGITIPRLHLGRLEARLKFDNGIATVEKFESNGDDVKVRAEGTVEIKEGKQGIRPDVGVEVFFDPKLQERSDTFQLMVNSAVKAKLEGDKAGWLGYRWVYYPLKRKSVLLSIKSNTLKRLQKRRSGRINRRVDPPRKAKPVKAPDPPKQAPEVKKPDSRVDSMRKNFAKDAESTKERRNDD